MIVGVSLGGSENSVLHVIEVDTGKLMGEAITRAQEAEPSWTDDSQGFYFTRMQAMAPGAPASTKYDNERIYFHRLGASEETDQPVFGPDITADLALPKNGNIFVMVVPGTGLLLAAQASGVVETPAVWLRSSDSGPGAQKWKQVVKHEDGMMDVAFHGTNAFIRTKGGANGAITNGRIVSFDLASETFTNAHVLLPDSDVVLNAKADNGVVAADDALYVYGFRNGLGVVTVIPYDDPAKHIELKLPISGTITGVDADLRRTGIIIGMAGWTTPAWSTPILTMLTASPTPACSRQTQSTCRQFAPLRSRPKAPMAPWSRCPSSIAKTFLSMARIRHCSRHTGPMDTPTRRFSLRASCPGLIEAASSPSLTFAEEASAAKPGTLPA